jgi:hypothetical protein
MLFAAKNVKDAVVIAEDMKLRGTHEWFRGQTRNWTLLSTLSRRHDTFEQEYKRIMAFSGWVNSTQGLEALWHKDDPQIAVAQHYGLATHFIDFTTEPSVAGYFASEDIPDMQPKALDLSFEEKRFFSSQPPEANIGCILCLNREKLMQTWNSIRAAGLAPSDDNPEFLELDVPDLWRLEAQHGVFFYCPFGRFEEALYDLDRIVFPHAGQVSWPPKEMIYPNRKSHLELLLDQYFLLERLAKQKEMTRLSGLYDLIPNKFVLDEPSAHEDSKYLASGPIPPHPSWRAAPLQSYTRPQPESFFVAHSELSCPVQLQRSNAAELANSVASQVQSFIKSNKDVRRHLVNWTVDLTEASFLPAFQKTATAIWDGLRAMPCADEDIAAAIGCCAGLLATAGTLGPEESSSPGRASCSRFFGSEVIEVEFGPSNSSFSRGYVSRDSLLSALRDDLASFLNASGRDRYFQSPEYLLMEIGKPERLFPFDRFVHLLLHQVVPTQAVCWNWLPLICSPGQISVFGIP